MVNVTAVEGGRGRKRSRVAAGIGEASKGLMDKITKTAALSFVFLVLSLGFFYQYQFMSTLQIGAVVFTFVISLILAYVTTEQEKLELRFILGTISFLMMGAFAFLSFNPIL